MMFFLMTPKDSGIKYPFYRLFAILIFSFFQSSVCYSFDCTKAKTATEKAICAGEDIKLILKKGVTPEECDDRKFVTGYSPPESAVVIGSGRLYFYEAPVERCESTNAFLVPGDRVVTYAVEEDYTEINYYSKRGSIVRGWVKRNRLKVTGSLSPQ